MAGWSLLTNHARLLVAVDLEPGLRQRELAARLGLSERGVALILRDLRQAGFVRGQRQGRRVYNSVAPGEPQRVVTQLLELVGQTNDVRGEVRTTGLTGHGLASEVQAKQSPRPAYYMRLHVADSDEAEDLANSLREHGGVVLGQQGQILELLWPAAETDEPAEEEEASFASLVLFLRSWRGNDPGRELTILEERAVEASAALLRDAS